MKMNDFKNMMKVFGEIKFTEELEIFRAIMDDGYPTKIIFKEIPGSYSDQYTANFPEWIKLNVLEILEGMLGEDFNFETIRNLLHCPWVYKKILYSTGKYEGYGLGYASVIESIPIDPYNKISIEIINIRQRIDHYRLTLKYKMKEEVIYVNIDDTVYNKEIKEIYHNLLKVDGLIFL